MIQGWVCEKCKKAGEVRYAKGAGVYEVIYLIEDDHTRVSPECEFSYSSVRIDGYPREES